MKIGQLPDVPLAASLANTQKTGKSGQAAGQPAATGATSNNTETPVSQGVPVTVSAQARALAASSAADPSSAASRASTRSADNINWSKVQSIREAIDKGTFKVNPEAIADKLMSNAQDALEKVVRRRA